MKKRFNITGTCRPEEHYMMDETRRFNAVMSMVERGEYFVINRPRQFGKTTLLLALQRELNKKPNYVPIVMSFQGISESHYRSSDAFSRFFFKELKKELRYTQSGLTAAEIEALPNVETLDDLSERITQLVHATHKRLVLLIDEADASSQYEPFLHFLGMLRTKYLRRDQASHYTFHSVVLTGVHDIKSLKFRLRNPEEAQYNSPWNIAADFKVTMEFYPDEIACMLREYAEAESVQMDIAATAERLYYYTSGHPFLISKLCKTVAEEILPQKADKNCWTADDLEQSVQMLLRENNTNFDSLIKNLENNQDLYELTYRILIQGECVSFSPDAPLTSLGHMYGIFKPDDKNFIKIHNRIYEQRLYNYMTVRRIEKNNLHNDDFLAQRFTREDGSLDMTNLLRRFQAFMKEQYSKRNRELIEREWRLIFLAFLKPIINGRGYDFKEVETSEEKRLDVVITYLRHRYIAELKIWRGEQAHRRGLDQLADYLDRHEVNEGWLLIFDNRAKPAWKQETIHHKGKQIFAVWV